MRSPRSLLWASVTLAVASRGGCAGLKTKNIVHATTARKSTHAHVGMGWGVSARRGSKSTSLLPAKALTISSTWPPIVWFFSSPETVTATPLRTLNGISRIVGGARPLLASILSL